MAFSKSLFAAILKSLLRGKSLLGALLAYWITPITIEATYEAKSATTIPHRTVEEFLKEAEALLLGPISQDGLQTLSAGLKRQFLERLDTHMECMLPSYSHQLPTGGESGRFLSLDVGGSTLRVALVELRGRGSKEGEEFEIVKMMQFFIDARIRSLEGIAFFEWMAARIAETLSHPGEDRDSLGPLPMALAWSFPIEQTSLGGGKLQAMGKGFMAHKGLVGQDLGQIVNLACRNHGLDVELRAIVNDSSASLLSRAYVQPSTRFSLIVGTGFNLAAYLPVLAIGRNKFGVRPDGWFDEASHVIVNTEASMFGRNILPLTRWDRQLLSALERPDFQPYEHLVSGMYLGEICRRILIEAIETSGVFGGVVPQSMEDPFSFGTLLASSLESDSSPDFVNARKIWALQFPDYNPSTADLTVLRTIASFVSARSSALVATCVYTLWDLRRDSQQALANSLPKSSPERLEAETDVDMEHTAVAFNGGVIEEYPGYLASCQKYLDDLVHTSSKNNNRRKVQLVPAKESSILGAAVALACVESVRR